ncbi:MAG: hypothetical protein EOP54_24055, partial [Sphingobacteriales bacterium]
MKKRGINILFAFLFCIPAYAQVTGYGFYSEIGAPVKPGFYSIRLTPALTPFIKTDYSDVRIVDTAGKWIPHIINSNSHQQVTGESLYKMEFEAVEDAAKNTVLMITASDSTASCIGLDIANTLARRFCSVAGSNDQQQWFSISDSIMLSPADRVGDDPEPFKIYFPVSRYKYYRITIYNSGKDPFQVTAVYSIMLNTQTLNAAFINNPPPSISQKDSGNVTIVKITQSQAYHFDQLEIKISGATYFNRKAMLYGEEENGNSSRVTMKEPMIISNNSRLKWPVTLNKSQHLYLHIYNEDNPPLTVTSATTALQEKFIMAFLDTGNSYRLIMNNLS